MSVGQITSYYECNVCWTFRPKCQVYSKGEENYTFVLFYYTSQYRLTIKESIFVVQS